MYCKGTNLIGGNARMRSERNPFSIIGSISGILILVLFLAGCGGSNSNTPAPTAQQLIKNAQAAIQKVSAYHFNLKADNLGNGGTLPISSADGDIVVPDKLKANATVLFSGSVVQAQLVA